METEIINSSQTKSEAIIKIFGYHNGTTQRKFEKLVKEKNINIEHFKRRPFKYKKIIKICPVCEKTFETQVGNREERTTCSYACANTYFRSGKNNPKWKDSTYRTTCFSNHKKECIICGENKIVAVHHYDENNKNNNPENLIPLCPTHHQYFHSKYKDEVIDKINEYRTKFQDRLTAS